MKKNLVFLAGVFLSTYVLAQGFEDEEISYKMYGNTAAVTFKHSKGYSGNVVVPRKIKVSGQVYYVTSIEDQAFSGCSSLTSVTIPESVTSIGDQAFSGCSSLTSVAIPGSVTWIGDQAFSGCSSLTSVTIPESVTSIGDQAFSGCSSLTSVAIPGSVTWIDDQVFSGCSSLTSVAIPGSVTWIGDQAFSGCSSLTSVTIPESVTSIGDQAFSGCSSLTSVAIPGSVTWIGDQAFFGCSISSDVKVSVENVDDDRILDVPEECAEFPGDIYAWLSKNIKYPPICQEQGIQGRVDVQFIINTDGSVVNVKVLRSPDSHLSIEAKKLMSLMPKWKPARQGNKPVRMRYVLPVMFRLS